MENVWNDNWRSELESNDIVVIFGCVSVEIHATI